MCDLNNVFIMNMGSLTRFHNTTDMLDLILRCYPCVLIVLLPVPNYIIICLFNLFYKLTTNVILLKVFTQLIFGTLFIIEF